MVRFSLYLTPDCPIPQTGRLLHAFTQTMPTLVYWLSRCLQGWTHMHLHGPTSSPPNHLPFDSLNYRAPPRNLFTDTDPSSCCSFLCSHSTQIKSFSQDCFFFFFFSYKKKSKHMSSRRINSDLFWKSNKGDGADRCGIFSGEIQRQNGICLFMLDGEVLLCIHVWRSVCLLICLSITPIIPPAKNK